MAPLFHQSTQTISHAILLYNGSLQSGCKEWTERGDVIRIRANNTVRLEYIDETLRLVVESSVQFFEPCPQGTVMI